MIIDKMPCEMFDSKSPDSIVSEDPEEVFNFPTEFLNTCVSGIPLPCVKVESVAIIILLKYIGT